MTQQFPTGLAYSWPPEAFIPARGGAKRKYNHDLIIQLYQNGMNATEIGRKIGCGNSTVGQILKDNNISKRSTRKFDHELIIRLYKQGKSQEKIAKQVGCSRSGVEGVLHKNNIIFRKVCVKKQEV